MKNRKAQLLQIMMVFVVLIMAGFALLMHFRQEENISNSLVPVGDIALIRIKRDLFEIQEKNLILVSARETSENFVWGSKMFETDFRERFLGYILAEGSFKAALFENILINGQKPELFDDNGFVRAIYDTSFEGGSLKVVRNSIEKFFTLKTSEIEKINFAVDVNYKYKKDYIIKQEDL